jgi:hypothetical protein
MIDLSVLPKEAQNELYDFYHFLVERYGKKDLNQSKKAKAKSSEIDAFFDSYNINLKGFSFNRDEIYER